MIRARAHTHPLGQPSNATRTRNTNRFGGGDGGGHVSAWSHSRFSLACEWWIVDCWWPDRIHFFPFDFIHHRLANALSGEQSLNVNTCVSAATTHNLKFVRCANALRYFPKWRRQTLTKCATCASDISDSPLSTDEKSMMRVPYGICTGD